MRLGTCTLFPAPLLLIYMLINVGILSTAVVTTWVLWKTFRQWILKCPLDNIPGPPADSFITGVFSKMFHRDAWEYRRYLADTYGGLVRIRGLLGENQLYTYDPKVLHHVYIKDQHIFEVTDQFIGLSSLVFGPGLLGALGEQHRKQRKMLNPVFSVANMREMVPMFYEITNKLCSALVERVNEGPREIDILSWMNRTALEMICQSGLGYSVDNLVDDEVQHPYSTAAKGLIPSLTNLIYAVIVFSPFSAVGPAKLRRLIVNILPWKALHHTRDIVDVLHNTSIEIYESKRKALEEGHEVLAAETGQGKDIMSILMRANMHASLEDSLTKDELIAQMSTLMFAATDTTSNTLARVLYLLSSHQDIQKKLRREIHEAQNLHGRHLPYEELISLSYLDAICRETLRLYPVITTSNRVARQDVVVPLLNPIKGVDGRDLKEIFIPMNTKIMASIMHSNTNAEIWGADAREWKPERWLKPLPSEVTAAHLPGVYSNIMTFSGGSRACIGFKLSQLEMKVVLLLLIESFQFSLSKKEISWQLAEIVFPVVAGGDGVTPELPIIVERLM